MTLVSDIDFFGGDATGDEWSESRSEGGDASSGIPSKSTDPERASDARSISQPERWSRSQPRPCSPLNGGL